jgi:type IV pilus assembly protein PilC
MIRAGEASGRLGESLDRYVALADRELRSRKKVKEATLYPKIVVGFMIAAFIALLTFVIPTFARVYAQYNTPLPLPTRIMIGMNDLFQHYWYLLFSVLLFIPILVKRYIQTEKGRVAWDKFKTKIPVLGHLFVIAALSRFAHTFVMLNKSGIPLLQTLEVTSTTINNVVISQSLEEVSRQIKEGRGLADSMKQTGRFTPLVIQMVGVGETTGTLDEMLMRVTEYYDIELENAMKRMTTYITPALTLFLAVIVMFLMLAVMLPWWNMTKLFKL